MQENRQFVTIIPAERAIPTLSDTRFRAANAGSCIVEVVEGNRKANEATHVLASLEIGSVSPGDEFWLEVGVDADGVFDFAVRDSKTRKKLAHATYSVFPKAFCAVSEPTSHLDSRL